jgi:hypothetical protein
VFPSDLPGVNPTTLNGMLLYYRLMTKGSGLGDSTELSRVGLSHSRACSQRRSGERRNTAGDVAQSEGTTPSSSPSDWPRRRRDRPCWTWSRLRKEKFQNLTPNSTAPLLLTLNSGSVQNLTPWSRILSRKGTYPILYHFPSIWHSSLM